MTAFLETMELAGLAVVLFTVAGAAVSALAFPGLRGWLSRRAPGTRADLLLAFAAAPILAGLLFTVVCFLPGEFGAEGFHDHCDKHPGHVHLCIVHHPPLDQGAIGWLVLALASAAVAFAGVRQGRRVLRSARAVAGLRRLSRAEAGCPGINVIDADAPLSATAGLIRPETYVSSGLVRAVDAEVMGVVQAHELAHVRRRDPLRQVLAAVLSMSHFPGTRRRLLEDLALATELACDEDAARSIGDRVQVARAVLAVERLLSNVRAGPDLIAASFGGSHVALRVETLLADADWRGSGGARVSLAVGFAVLLLAASSLHHATETLLSWITR